MSADELGAPQANRQAGPDYGHHIRRDLAETVEELLPLAWYHVILATGPSMRRAAAIPNYQLPDRVATGTRGCYVSIAGTSLVATTAKNRSAAW